METERDPLTAAAEAEAKFRADVAEWMEAAMAMDGLTETQRYARVIDRLHLAACGAFRQVGFLGARLAEHHRDIDAATDADCPVCAQLASHGKLLRAWSSGEQSYFALLALAVAEYRSAFGDWPTTVRANSYLYLTEVEMAVAEGIIEAVSLSEAANRRLERLEEDSGEEILVGGPDGERGHAAGTVALGSPAHHEAARWLYDDLWEMGIESSGVDGEAA